MPEVEFVVFEPADCRMADWFSGLPNVETRATPIPSEGRWRKLFYSSRFWGEALRQDSFDLFECFHLPLPNVPSGKIILTVHDVRRLHPDWSLYSRTAFRLALAHVISNADMVVTVSEAMKQELLPYCGMTPISVILNGLEATAKDFHPSMAEQEALRCKLSLPVSFLLAVGHFERRKNYPRLIEALAHLREAGRPYHLLIVGNESGEKEALKAQIAAHGLTGNVTLASGLSDMEVRCAYALCKLFVFPSIYEGFGIPILEAMAAGKPIVLSDISVFREITLNQAIYFPARNPHAMASVIAHALDSPAACDAMVEFGHRRVQEFNFDSLAQNLVNIYLRLL